MKTFGSVILLILSLLFLSSHKPGDEHLKVRVLTEKPEVCNYKGIFLKKGLVKGAVSNAQVEVLVFLQQYNGHWMKKYYQRNGSGVINMNLGDCRFTGNFHALAYYINKNQNSSVTYKDIQHLHNKRGENPKFRITKRLKEENGTVKIMEGEVFTPNGETVDLTLFLEKKDGGWRKKHYTVHGSGIVKLDITGSDLTGKYRSALNIKL